MKNFSISKYEIIVIIAVTILFNLSTTYGGLSPVMFIKTLPLVLLNVVVLWLILRLLFKK